MPGFCWNLDETQSLPAALQLAEDSLELPERSLFVIRLSLSSPVLEHPLNGVDYLERYCSHLMGVIRHELTQTDIDGEHTRRG